MNTHFSDYLKVSPKVVQDWGAFNVSLINDLPLFIDPFLLFNSEDEKYQTLHRGIVQYLVFLRDRSGARAPTEGEIKAWYCFKEVRQNWLGFSQSGNGGRGLGRDFALALHGSLNTIFSHFGDEKVTKGTHLEKLCLIKEGVGRDSISDFTTNLIKEFLLEYSQEFALKHLAKARRKKISVPRAAFNYKTETWASKEFELPGYGDDFVLLTPRDILTKDDTWINRTDLYNDYDRISDSVTDDQLRAQLDNYLYSQLSKKPTDKEVKAAKVNTIIKFHELIDYYIKYKEDHGDEAKTLSDSAVLETEEVFVAQIKQLVDKLRQTTKFYEGSYTQAFERITFLKDVIENKDGYRLFYVKGKPVEREQDLQIMFKLTWFATDLDVNAEVNNGRGPADFKISMGSGDATIVEFKLASNTRLRDNLAKQVAIYMKASNAKKSIKAILYFSAGELDKVRKILKELELEEDKDVVLIDARSDNKPSASKA